MKLTPEQHFKAKKWAAENRTVEWIASQFGCARDTVRRVVDPEWRARRNLGIKLAKQSRNEGAAYHGDGLLVIPRQRPSASVIIERDRNYYGAAWTPNQQILGDPLPGRSALDRMRGRHA
jgi:hypothetical protein